MKFSTKTKVSDFTGLKDELARIIATALNINNSYLTLKVKADSKQRKENNFIIILAIKTSDDGMANKIKAKTFYDSVKAAIKNSVAFKEVTLNSIENTKCIERSK